MEASQKSDSVDSSDLLNQLEMILEADPLIDEVGFIHPSQFLAVSQEAGSTLSSLSPMPHLEDECVKPKLSGINPLDMVFWSRDHKLGISTESLFPLYNAAKHAFMAAMERYQGLNLAISPEESGEDDVLSCSSTFQNTCAEVMKHSRALLLLSSDFGTAWNIRKLIVSKEPHVSTLKDELCFSKLVLSYSPKSECTWSHRRWVIKMIAGECSNLEQIVDKESELAKMIAEKSKMNYRAWNHRCWLVSYMSSGQVMKELISGRVWAGLNVADNSCFHYRTRLMRRMWEDSWFKKGSKPCLSHDAEDYRIYKEELDWNEMLIKRYIGREALWLYRRFLSQYWMSFFVVDGLDASSHFNQQTRITDDINTFVDNELQLFYSCQGYSNNDFEDYHAQAMFSATYMLWIAKHFSQYHPGAELHMKLRQGDLYEVLNKLCPERISLWNSLKTMNRNYFVIAM